MTLQHRISVVFVLLVSSLLFNASWAEDNQPPVSDPNGPYTGSIDVPMTFDGSGSSDPEGSALTFDWDFGDGSTDIHPNPTYTYAASGIYTVTLKVTDEAGLVDSAMTTATIAEMYEIKFDPYFIGRSQRDNLIVVNHFSAAQPYSLRVVGTAYDPFTGEQLDSQTVEVIPAGQGVRIPITDTHPEPHASQLVVQVEVFYDDTSIIVDGDGPGPGGEVTPDPPFTITRILTARGDATLLQFKGVPVLLNGATH
jgi:PKD repeat protein